MRWLSIALAAMTAVLLSVRVEMPTTVAAPLTQESPLVLAFYYNWYDLNTWQSGTVTDTPQEPYASRDTATMARHVEQAGGAGIDAFIVSWYGPREAENQTETNFRQLLDIAAARGFYAAADFETQGPFFPDQAAVIEALRYLLTNHANHPAYLRYQGKPVVFFWRQQRFSVWDWQDIRAQVDPNHNTIWIAEGTDIGYQDVFDGHHLYSVAWSQDVNRTLADWARRVRHYEEQHQTDRLWVATAMPGYDDTRTTRSDAFSVDRRQGAYYQETWAAARDSNPDWVIVTSFNEWVEGTAIEPSAAYGDLYLNLTREESAAFKSGSYVQPAEPIVVETQSPPGQTPLPSDTTFITARETIRIRSGPGANYARLSSLPKGKQAIVIGQSQDGEWWQIEVDRSVEVSGIGWVTAEYTTLSGNAEAIPKATPSETTGVGETEAIRVATETTTSPSPILTQQPPTNQVTSTPTPTFAPRETATPLPSPTWPGSILATLTPSATPPFTTPAAPSETVSIPTKTEIAELHTGKAIAPARTPGPTSTVRTEVIAKRRDPATMLWLGIGAVTMALAIGASLGYGRKSEYLSRRHR